MNFFSKNSENIKLHLYGPSCLVPTADYCFGLQTTIKKRLELVFSLQLASLKHLKKQFFFRFDG